MKRLIVLLLCGALLLCASCGKTDAAKPSDDSSSADTETTLAAWDGAFAHLATVLPDGWTVIDSSSKTYLKAVYGEGDDAPVLTVTVTAMNDALAHVKAQMLSKELIKQEAQTVTDVDTKTIGGITFYCMTYASHLREKRLCRTCLGQSEPASGSRDYQLVEIRLDGLTDSKQLKELDSVFGSFAFRF